MRIPIGCAALLFALGAFAAPDEDLLGKAEGYPACPPTIVLVEQRCLVGDVSRRDEVYPSRKVRKAETPRPLARGPEPAIRYKYQGQDSGIDDYLARNRTTGLLILKDDRILVERYQYDRTAEHRMNSFSMAKTVVAMLVGIAVSEGSIRSVDDKAEQYVPELHGTVYGETPIRHLLTMTSGVRFVEQYSGTDDITTLGRRSLGGQSEGGVATLAPFKVRDHAPGAQFNYASADTQVLGLVLRAATGKPLADYLSEKIWQPMGAEADATWLIDRGGYEIGFAGINATLRDYGRLGLLLADGGTRDGRQVIPGRWVRAATTPSSARFEPGKLKTTAGQSSFLGYGYQTWLLPGKERQFMLLGLRGQQVLVDPASRLVLVQTTAGSLNEGRGELLSLWNSVTRTLAK